MKSQYPIFVDVKIQKKVLYERIQL